MSFAAGPLAQRYIEDTGLEWPLVVDHERSLYEAYGMLTASFWQIWGPRTWLAYARELLRGQRLVRSSEDVYQRGGDVLVDPTGIVRLHHVGDGPADRPPVERLLASISEPAVSSRPSPD